MLLALTIVISSCNIILPDNSDEETSMGHQHSLTEVAEVKATCTANGTKTAKCDRCDVTDTIADDGSMKGHSLAEAVKENVVDVTCTTDGSYDSVVYCSVCNEVLVAQEVVEALGHDWADATTEAPKTCKTCGATEGEKLPLPVEPDTPADPETPSDDEDPDAVVEPKNFFHAIWLAILAFFKKLFGIK